MHHTCMSLIMIPSFYFMPHMFIIQLYEFAGDKVVLTTSCCCMMLLHLLRKTEDNIISFSILQQCVITLILKIKSFRTCWKPQDLHKSQFPEASFQNHSLLFFHKTSSTNISTRLQCRMAVNPAPADIQSMMRAIATLTAQLMAITVLLLQKTMKPSPTVSTFAMTPD